jgi:hypothetical protein
MEEMNTESAHLPDILQLDLIAVKIGVAEQGLVERAH